ncbi:hypothetical protein MY1884_009190 [Beauveria asiatica]
MFSLTDNLFWPEGFPIFDFSLKFEQNILQILPSASLILFKTTIVFHYLQNNVRISQSKLSWTKVTVTFVLCALELASLVLGCLSTAQTDTTDPATALDLVAAVAVAAVVYVECRHAIRTPTLLGLYLALCTLIDVTDWMPSYQD